MSIRRRYLRGALAVTVALAVGTTVLPASADRNSLNDKKRQREQVRQRDHSRFSASIFTMRTRSAAFTATCFEMSCTF